MKKFFRLLLIVVLGIGLVACNNDDNAAEDHDHDVVEDHDHDHDHDEEEHDHDHDHSHGEYEWIGTFEFDEGEYLFHFGASEDETMDVGFVKLGDNVTDLEHHASHLMAIEEKEDIAQGSSFDAMADYVYTLEMDPEHGHIHFNINDAGTYAIVTEHLPEESNMQIFDSNENEILPVDEIMVEGHDHDHDHDDEEEHDHDHDHSHGEYEWIGTFEFDEGEYLFHFGPSEDETMDVGFVKLGDNVTDLEHHASHLMAIEEKEDIAQGSSFDAMADYVYTLEMDPEHGHIHFNINDAGTYAIVTEHLPEESNMQIFDSNENEIMPVDEIEVEGHHHEH